MKEYVDDRNINLHSNGIVEVCKVNNPFKTKEITPEEKKLLGANPFIKEEQVRMNELDWVKLNIPTHIFPLKERTELVDTPRELAEITDLFEIDDFSLLEPSLRQHRVHFPQLQEINYIMMRIPKMSGNYVNIHSPDHTAFSFSVESFHFSLPTDEPILLVFSIFHAPSKTKLCEDFTIECNANGTVKKHKKFVALLGETKDIYLVLRGMKPFRSAEKQESPVYIQSTWNSSEDMELYNTHTKKCLTPPWEYFFWSATSLADKKGSHEEHLNLFQHPLPKSSVALAKEIISLITDTSKDVKKKKINFPVHLLTQFSFQVHFSEGNL